MCVSPPVAQTTAGALSALAVLLAPTIAHAAASALATDPVGDYAVITWRSGPAASW
ncbi:hypothetical protein [Streptomyces mirabilis]